ncbi:MAG: glycosyl hydrolase, partial [Cyclobacteriaceae bacterium]
MSIILLRRKQPKKMVIDQNIELTHLTDSLDLFWQLSGEKILSIEQSFNTSKGAPVITQAGKYVAQGWTEWTQGFQFGSAILQYDASGDDAFLQIGRD